MGTRRLRVDMVHAPDNPVAGDVAGRRGIDVKHLRAMSAAGVAAALLTVVSCSSSSPPPLKDRPVGTVADTGFRPSQNGFAFQNYGDLLSNGSPPINLTAADVQEMFGDSVCADAQLRRCDLIPEAQAWLDETNQSMAGGHCFGFSVLAELLWLGQTNASTYGAPQPAGLQVLNNQALQRQLAYDWAVQLLQSVQADRINGTPNQILTKLTELLKPHPAQTYTVVFWKKDFTGGHAVTPYEVVNEGGGMFKVLIYDNNWPDQTRAIVFDTNTDTWTYDAAANPDQPESVYTGDAETKTISLYPTSPGLGTQPCPFCAKQPAKASGQAGNNMEEITLLGSDTNHANLVVTDDAGHRLGYVNGTLVNEIPGAHVDEVISNQDWANNITPDFFVPADNTYTIKIDATGLSSPDTESLAITGPSYDVSIKKIPVNPGSSDTLVVEPDGTHISYTGSSTQSPAITLGVSDTQADYSFDISGVADQPGSTINLGLPPEGGSLALQYVGAAPASSVSVKMTRSTEQGVQVFNHSGIPLTGTNKDQLQFGNWTSPSQGIPLIVTRNGEQSTQTLANQATQ
jgi:hypothetical protein